MTCVSVVMVSWMMCDVSIVSMNVVVMIVLIVLIESREGVVWEVSIMRDEMKVTGGSDRGIVTNGVVVPYL